MGGMNATPSSSSLRIALMLAGGIAELSGTALRTLWSAWTGETRLARALANLEASGLIERFQGGREVDARIYRLTEAGRAAAAGGRFPPERWSRSWDGKWRMLMFDIPQREASIRVRIRRHLMELGCGAIQRSVWITPDRLDGIVSSMPEVAHRPGSLLLFEGRPGGGVSDDVVVGDAWDFAGINRGYAEYLNVLAAHPAATGHLARTSATPWKNWLKAEGAAWQHAVNHDPLLPDALLPSGYRGKEAWERRLETLNSLPELG